MRKSDPLCSDCTKIRQRSIKGDLHPAWNPSITQEDRENWSRVCGIQSWYRTILRLSSFTCAITGKLGGVLSAHHIYNYADYPDLRLSISNGVVIKQSLHKEFHRRYGRGNNTLFQFKEFFYLKTGREFNTEVLNTSKF